MNTNEIDEIDEHFMIFKLEEYQLNDIKLEDLDLEYSNKYIYEKNNIENNKNKYIYYNIKKNNINNNISKFKLPKPIDSSKRKIYILSHYAKS